MGDRPSRSRPPDSVRGRIPLPGRPRWAWLLGTGLRRWRIRRILRSVVPHVASGSTILDVGSGPGYDAEELARLLPRGQVGRWVLLDPQPEMLAQARRNLARPPTPEGPWALIVGDAAALPLRDGSADVVLSLGVLCCMAEGSVPAAIAETTRALRPGGWLVFGIPPWRREGDIERWEQAGVGLVSRPRRGAALLQKRL
ncbi:MAG: class I SAM-dependent methyltransferase [Thermoplasmata archaeon]|nr:class I SAM-dependent methyltransferase [Thermoplasmata archaeon]